MNVHIHIDCELSIMFRMKRGNLLCYVNQRVNVGEQIFVAENQSISVVNGFLNEPFELN
jgi:hypothetical protein